MVSGLAFWLVVSSQPCLGCLVSFWDLCCFVLLCTLCACTCVLVHLFCLDVVIHRTCTDLPGLSFYQYTIDGSTHAFAPVIPPVRPAITPVVPSLVLTVGLVPTPALTSVFLPVKPALVPKLLPWLTADQIFHLIVLLFLDLYEVLFTNVKPSKYLTYNQRIVAWYEQHKRLQAQGHFVPDPAMSTVRTSRGDIVYPDVRTV